MEAQQCVELTGTNGRGLDPLSSTSSICLRFAFRLQGLGSRSILCVGTRRCRAAAPRTVEASAVPARDGAAVARRAHNPKVGGSNPSPATKIRKRSRLSRGGFAVCRGRAMRLHAADVAADRSRYRSRGGRQGNSATCSPVCPCHKRVRHAIMLSLVVRARRTHPFSFRTRK